MDLEKSLLLFGLLSVLAAVPSSSVALVVTQSVTQGVKHGLGVAAGIVLGDLAFLVPVLLGGSLVAETQGWLFTVIQYLGGIVLAGMGLRLWTAAAQTKTIASPDSSGSHINSFLAGLFLTLSDSKAMVFYISLMPFFITTGTAGPVDIGIIVLITIAAVGGVKSAYAVMASRLASLSVIQTMAGSMQRIAAAGMIAAGVYLLWKI